MDESAKERIARICRDVLAPLVRADGGEMHLVRLDGDDLHIHLSGTCSGCPGVSLTGDHMLLPALRSGSPKLRLFITTGTVVPDGAEKL